MRSILLRIPLTTRECSAATGNSKRLYFLAKERLPAFLLLSNEGCSRCQTCTYPESPCRYPEMLFPSLEGYGIYVSELAARASLSYNNGPNTVTYFGMLLYSE